MHPIVGYIILAAFFSLPAIIGTYKSWRGDYGHLDEKAQA